MGWLMPARPPRTVTGNHSAAGRAAQRALPNSNTLESNMASIHVNDLKVGIEVPADLLDSSGNVLVLKGVKVTDAVIAALRRRNFEEVWIRDEGEEVMRILSTKFLALEDIAMEPEDGADVQMPAAPPKALLEFPELRDLRKGKEGFAQILETSKVKEFESRIENTAGLPDRPMGDPLASKVRQIAVAERTVTYKNAVSTDYDGALEQTFAALQGLRSGRRVDGNGIRKLAARFVTTFVTDRNILLNISGTKSKTNDYLYNHS